MFTIELHGLIRYRRMCYLHTYSFQLRCSRVKLSSYFALPILNCYREQFHITFLAYMKLRRHGAIWVKPPMGAKPDMLCYVQPNYIAVPTIISVNLLSVLRTPFSLRPICANQFRRILKLGFSTGVLIVISHINYCGHVKTPARWLSRHLKSPKPAPAASPAV